MRFKSNLSWLLLLPFILYLAANALMFSNVSNMDFVSQEVTTELSATVVEVQRPDKIELCTIRTEEYGERIHLSHLVRWIEPEDLAIIKPGDTIYFREYNGFLEADIWCILTLKTEDTVIVSLEEREAEQAQSIQNGKIMVGISSLACITTMVFLGRKIRKDLKEHRRRD